MGTEQLAILGGEPQFSEVLHVGRPNIGNREHLQERIDGVLDRRWFTNRGPLVQELEIALQQLLDVEHVIAVCNGTLGLEIATRAAEITGEVIVPAFTFVATAHAIQWQGLTPVFADIDLATHTIDPSSVASLVTPRTSAIVGVHTWGVGCATEELEALAADRGLTVVYDAAHALGCTHRGVPIGGNGKAEVFSFHATKYVNAFEGGAIATNDGDYARRIRDMVNFGFAGYDRVVSVGTNAKMSEMSAAMGLTSLESMGSFAAVNRDLWSRYEAGLSSISGIDLLVYPAREINSHQYVVVRVGEECLLDRDAIVEVLHAEGCLARRYFYPGVHRMEPYASLNPMASRWLSSTELLSGQVLILPTGTGMRPDQVDAICAITRSAVGAAPEVAKALVARA